MPNVTKISLNNTTYVIKDATARSGVAANAESIATQTARIDQDIATQTTRIDQALAGVANNSNSIATQAARIDQITQLPSGSTSGDAELMDVRVGADSVTYASAGSAVRTQFSNLDESLTNGGKLLSNGEVQFCYSASAFTATVTYSSNGTQRTLSQRYSSKFFDCSLCDYIKFLLCGNASSTNDVNVISFFDSSRRYISGISGNDHSGAYQSIVAVPSGAKYAVGSWYTGRSETPYMNGILRKNIDDIFNEVRELPSGVVTLCDSSDDFSFPTLYSANGTERVLSKRYSSDFIECASFDHIEFRLNGLNHSTNDVNIISFFDQNKTYIGGIPGERTSSPYESKIEVPSNAKYLVGSWYSDASGTPYIKGCCDTVKPASDGTAISNENPFVHNYMIYGEDNKVVISKQYTTYLIDCSEYGRIAYSLNQYRDSSHDYNIITFYDADKNVTGCVPYDTSKSNRTYNSGSAYLPDGTVYLRASWYMDSTDVPLLVLYKVDRTDDSIFEINHLIGNTSSTSLNIVNGNMTRHQFVAAINNEYANYATRCLVYRNAFHTLDESASDIDLYERINRNFRDEVAIYGSEFDRICERVNIAFSKPILRFMDAKMNLTNPHDFSLNTGVVAFEPSVTVSDDGGTMYIHAARKVFSTTDGIKWSTPVDCTFTPEYSPAHYGVSYIEGVYYLIGVHQSDQKLNLYTSENGINYTFAGTIFNLGEEMIPDYQVTLWGNPFLYKDNDTWYLYIESKDDTHYWMMDVVTCTDLLHDNGNGTIGNWVKQTAHVFDDRVYFNDPNSRSSAGNPDFVKGPDNRPIKYDGKYYMLFHSTYKQVMYIIRAYSYDLIHWTPDGYLLRNHDEPTAGDLSAGNADHCCIEFKGKSYLFYTWNINSQNTNYIKYVVDDRPFRELLKLRP